MGKILDRLIERWFTESVDAIMRRLDAIERQGKEIMAKVVDLVGAVNEGTAAVLTAIGEETAELATIIQAQNDVLAALEQQIANGEFVTVEQVAGVRSQFADIETRIRAVSDAVTAAPASPA